VGATTRCPGSAEQGEGPRRLRIAATAAVPSLMLQILSQEEATIPAEDPTHKEQEEGPRPNSRGLRRREEASSCPTSRRLAGGAQVLRLWLPPLESRRVEVAADTDATEEMGADCIGP
jgi:hypothetical protein